MGRPKKDPFEDAPDEWKSMMEAASDAEIREEVARVAFAEAENRKNKAEDQQLQEAKATAKEAGAQYAEATAANNSKIKFARALLVSRGKL